MIETEPYKVLGIDPALTAMGVAGTTGPDLDPVLICVKPKLQGHERLALLLSEVRRLAAGADLVVIENLPGYVAHVGTTIKQAELLGLIKHKLWELGIPYALVAPAQVKQFATGSGSADKHDVVRAVYRRWPRAERWGRVGPDEADALWLAAMGAQWLREPIVALPLAQADVVHAVWDGKTRGHKRGDPKIVWPSFTPRRDVVEADIVGDDGTPLTAAEAAELF